MKTQSQHPGHPRGAVRALKVGAAETIAVHQRVKLSNVTWNTAHAKIKTKATKEISAAESSNRPIINNEYFVRI